MYLNLSILIWFGLYLSIHWKIIVALHLISLTFKKLKKGFIQNPLPNCPVLIGNLFQSLGSERSFIWVSLTLIYLSCELVAIRLLSFTFFGFYEFVFFIYL